MKSAKFHILAISCILMLSCTKKKAPDHTGMYEEMRYVEKMEFAQMALTKTMKTERTDWYKLGKRIAVYSYDTYLKAFIDLGLLNLEDLEFDEEKKTVKVTLPPVQIEIAGRDMELKKEYENVGLLRTDIGSEERAEMKEKANELLKKELKGNPEYKRQLEETARRKARAYFESMFKKAGYKAIIRFSDDAAGKGDFNLTNYD